MVKNKMLVIYAVKKVDEVCEILMNKEFGTLKQKDTICYCVYHTLKKYADICKEYKV